MRWRLRQAGQRKVGRGQVGLRQAGEAGHHVVRLIATAALVLLLLSGAAAWRLARGPIALPPLAARIGTAATRALPGFKVTIGSAALAWEGFHQGGAPVDLRLSDIRIVERSGIVTATISQLRVTLAPAALLHGRIAPIEVLAAGPVVTIRPALLPAPPPSSRPSPPADLQGAADRIGRLLHDIGLPPHQGRFDIAYFRSLRIGHARLDLYDQVDHPELAARDGALDLARGPDRTITGTASAKLRHGAALVPVGATITAAGPDRFAATIGPIDPASVAPPLSALARADLPVTLAVRWDRPTGLTFHVTAGAGQMQVGGSTIPIRAFTTTLHADAHRLDVTSGSITLGAPGALGALGAPGATGQTARFGGSIGLNQPVHGSFTLAFDRMTAAEFDHDWPRRLLVNVRHYVLTNVKAGAVSDGAFLGAFDLGPKGKLRIRAFSGQMDAAGVTLAWFKHAVPMTGLAGTLVFRDKDTLAIDATTGRLGKLALHGTMLITTLTHHDQDAKVDIAVQGSVADAFTILNRAPLRLAAHGMGFAGIAGKLSAGIDARLPLKKHLQLHDVHLAAAANLTALHLPLPLGRLALDDGSVAMSATLHHLAVHGHGALAGHATRFHATMALPDGALDVDADTSAGRTLLAALGANPAFWRRGLAPITLHYRDRNGHGALGVGADLTAVALAVPAASWRKPAGRPAHATVELALRHGRPAGVDAVSITAPGLMLRAHRAGPVLVIDDARLNDTRAAGTLTPPVGTGRPWRLVLAGPMLDLAALLHRATGAAGTPAPTATKPAGTLPWQVAATFATIRLTRAPGAALGPARIHASGNEGDVARLQATARLGPAHHARLDFIGGPDSDEVWLNTGDAGALLAAFGATTDVMGGVLTVTATRRAATTSGKAVLTDFRLRHAPVMAKVLQGLSIYGVPAATSGPGLALGRLVAPFSIAKSVVHLGNGRVASPSLGFTGTGTIDLARKTYDLSGTIVPAYALNALPGKIPLIGKLFSPEKGSGLFAARYTVVGPFARPHIMVDPLAALAPGVLREIFGIGPPAKP